MHTKINLTKVLVAGTAATAAATGAAEAQGFDGAYVGLGVGAHGGILEDGYEYGVVGPPVAQAFAGFNIVTGDMLYGGEISAVSSSTYDAGDYGITSAVDVKGRVGRVFGNTMIYGAVGFSSGGYEFAGGSETFSGGLLGVGFETNLTDNMFLGADYTARFASQDSGSKIATPISTVSIRAGFRF